MEGGGRRSRARRDLAFPSNGECSPICMAGGMCPSIWGARRPPGPPPLARVRLSADRGLGGADAPPGRIHSIFPLFPRRRQNTKVDLLCVIPEYSREHSRWEHHIISPVKPRRRQDLTEGFLWDTPPMLPKRGVGAGAQGHLRNPATSGGDLGGSRPP